jgi:replicative DNA helicase
VDIVLQKYRSRKLYEIGLKVVQMTKDGQSDVEVRVYVDEELGKLSLTKDEDCVTFKENLGRMVDRLMAIIEGKIDSGLKTGLEGLDELLGGLHDGEMIVLTGPTGGGKTALAHGIISHAAFEDNKPVLLFSYEMRAGDVTNRIIASRCSINTNNFRTGLFTDNEFVKITSALNELGNKNIFIVDNVGLTMDEIRAKAAKYKALHGIKLVVIDYIQKIPIKEEKNGDSRQREVAKLSDSIQKMAMQLDLPVLALCQHNKQGDAREAQDIEFDAKCLIKIKHIDDSTGFEGDCAPRLIIVEKNNNGPTGALQAVFMKRYVRFENCYPFKEE